MFGTEPRMITTDKNISTEMDQIFLELGKTLFICQSFEESLLLLHAQMSHEEAAGENGAFSSSWDFHSSKTLGQLINTLRKRIDIPEDLSDFLEFGLKTRNKIVHGFITTNIQRLSHPKGRLDVESELVAMKLEVKKCDMVVNKLLDVLFAKYGFSNADLKRNADAQWIYLNETASGSTQ
jgi:hypothetical protein